MNKEYAEKLLTILKRFERADLWEDRGICGNVDALGADMLNNGDAWAGVYCTMMDIWVTWPNFSGDETYPIPGGMRGFDMAADAHALWTGEQGALRRELVAFLINTLEKRA